MAIKLPLYHTDCPPTVPIAAINGYLVYPPAGELQTLLAHGRTRESLRPVDVKSLLGAIFSFLQHQNWVSVHTLPTGREVAKVGGLTYQGPISCAGYPQDLCLYLPPAP